ncbi:MAG: hypothetical protein ACJAYB_002703 [Psychromonas sp.]|jgi:hypothetical protein
MIAKVTNKAMLSSKVFSINLLTYPVNQRVISHIDPGKWVLLSFALKL